MIKTPPGIRRNNPGNLEKGAKATWQGLSTVQTDPRFWLFDDAVYGMRAICRQLIAYQDQHDCATVVDSISRYAPPSDNNPTNVYSTNVALAITRYTGETCVAAKTTVDWHQYRYLRPALEAIIVQENGKPYTTWYSSAQLDKACVLAGVEPAKKSIAASGQIIGGSLAAVATVAQPVVETLKTQLQPLVEYSDTIKHIFIVASLIGVALVVFSKINERRKGIS